MLKLYGKHQFDPFRLSDDGSFYMNGDDLFDIIHDERLPQFEYIRKITEANESTA